MFEFCDKNIRTHGCESKPIIPSVYDDALSYQEQVERLLRINHEVIETLQKMRSALCCTSHQTEENSESIEQVRTNFSQKIEEINTSISELETNFDMQYSLTAGAGITISNGEIINSAPNVKSDWNAVSGDALILNKPDLSVYALAANVTKSVLGIDNVDNTSDADKPISTAAETALAGKVDKETNKSLMSADEHTKLNGIEAGAQVNVQSDWEQNNSNADDFIKNKPANLVQDASYVHTDNNFTNAEKAKADGAIQSTEKGTAGGVAELDEYGHVPVSQLPSFVSDVIDGYYDSETTHKFYADAQHQTEIQGQSNKIYVDVNTNLSYRWSGSVFAEVSPSLALGSTDSTAYRGDWGTADHAAIGVLASLNTSEKSSLVAAINELQSGSVSVDPDRGLSENDFTDSLKSKLDGIESGAEVNVQSDWNQTVTTADDFIRNKPENLVQDASYVHTDNNYTTEEKTKLNNVNAGQMVYLSESTAKILTDSPRSLSESLLNYKIIEVRYLQLEETISGTTYQTWGWARLIKSSSGDFMSAPVIHFISNGSSLTIKAYEIGILSANPTKLALTRDTSGSGLWTGAIIGYK